MQRRRGVHGRRACSAADAQGVLGAAFVLGLLAGACGDGGDDGDGVQAGGGSGGTAPDAATPGGGGGEAPGPDAQVDDAGPEPDAAVGPVIEPGCNPVGGEWDCLLPFPSDVFRVAAPGNGSGGAGFRLDVPPVALPHDADGLPLDLLATHPADGFSPIAQILALVPTNLAPGQLVTLDGDFTGSLSAESRTVLLDAERGERVLHIAEADPRALDPTRRAVVIRPQVRLRDGARYIVALRNLTDAEGQTVASPPSFAALREGAGPEALQARYDAAIFPALATAGVPRDDVFLAWDFTTRSESDATGDMLAVRAATMAALEGEAPAITEVVVTENPNEHVARRIDAVLEVPLFTETPTVGASLRRGPDGRPVAQGTARVPLLALLPRSLADDPSTPGRFLQFGHGFFGVREEIADNFVFEFADRFRFVVAAVDWWGMSAADSPDVIGQIINDPPRSLRFIDRVHQGMANFIALSYAANTTLRALPALQLDGAPAFDASEVYFYGISQGGILGGTYLALAPKVSRGVLSVGGAGFGMLMHRARPFIPFMNVIASRYPDALDQQKFVALAQGSLDRIDPMSYAPHLVTDLYPGSPAARSVLMQLGVGDSQVPNLGHHAMARTLDLPLLNPAPRAVLGVRTVDGPVDGSALVEFGFGLPEPVPGTFADFPAEGNAAHEGVRRSDAGQRQIDGFLRPDGRIEHTCDGPCDPE